MRRILVVGLAVLGMLASSTVAADATFPGDNGRIWFDRGSGEDDDQPPRVMTVTPDGTDFTTPVEAGRDPVPSPNGRLIAYHVPEPMGAGHIAIARTDGTGARAVADDLMVLQHPSWAPDGQQVVASSGFGLHVIDVATATIERTVSPGCTANSPAWSPDGQRILFAGQCNDDDLDMLLWTIRPDGTDLQPLSTNTGPDRVDDGFPSWSPDGQRVVFDRRVDGSDAPTKLMVVDADGTDQRALDTGAGYAWSPVWSPDGSEIAFARENTPDGTEIWGIGPDGSGLRQITRPPSPVLHRPTGWEAVTSPTASACPEGDVPESGFHDVTGTHAAAVDCAAWHELVQGRADGSYAAVEPVRRDQMASFVARLLGRAGVELPEPSSQGFTDIAGNVHADAINQLAELGVVHGVDDATYAPARPVTRAQMASFLVRAYELAADAELGRVFDEFADDDGSAHEEAIDRAAFAGFAAGTSVSTYAPAESVRRDQMATFLVRTADRLVRDGLMELPE